MAGGFLWDLADQGVVRNDRNNEMDTDGNHGADGILGPYREKEGSFYTIKEIWSPIYIEGMDYLPLSFDGRMKVENRYHFANLNQCRFTAEWVKWDYPTGQFKVQPTTVEVPSVEPGLTGYLRIMSFISGQSRLCLLSYSASCPSKSFILNPLII